jgi:predicted protein tyrosine phosphatase
MNILFLCTSNIQRSRTAEEIFRTLDGSNNYKSARLSAKYTTRLGSTLCTKELLNWSEHIYVFEEKHIERIREYTNEQHISKITNLKIDDEYQYLQRELVLLLLKIISIQRHIK